MKKASPDRIRELLRIVDSLAAPFGSQEDLLLGYGIEGMQVVDVVRDATREVKAANSLNKDPTPGKFGQLESGLQFGLHRLVRRRGRNKAAVAVGHSILVIVWHLLQYDRP